MKYFWYNRIKNKELKPGISREHFRKLIKLSGIHSQGAIQAMEAYFVDEVTRKEACEKYGVSQSYFSVSLKKIRLSNKLVADIIKYYLM